MENTIKKENSRRHKDRFELLTDERIIRILIGKDSSMPKLDSYDVTRMAKRFDWVSFRTTNLGNGRSFLLDFELSNSTISFRNLMVQTVGFGSVSILLNYLFSKENFADTFRYKNVPKDVFKFIEETKRDTIDKINEVLFLSNYKLMQDKSGEFHVVELNEVVNPSMPELITIEYIKKTHEESLKWVDSGNCAQAVSESKNLVEATFQYVIAEAGGEIKKSDTMKELHKKVKNLYNLHQEKEKEKWFNHLLYGLETIVDSVMHLRNESGVPHANFVGGKFKIDICHARLCVNASAIVSEFLLSVCKNSVSKDSEQCANAKNKK